MPQHHHVHQDVQESAVNIDSKIEAVAHDQRPSSGTENLRGEEATKATASSNLNTMLISNDNDNDNDNIYEQHIYNPSEPTEVSTTNHADARVTTPHDLLNLQHVVNGTVESNQGETSKYGKKCILYIRVLHYTA